MIIAFAFVLGARLRVADAETARRLLEPPRLRTLGEDEERRATWLELFLDLVFVAAVADGLDAQLGRRRRRAASGASSRSSCRSRWAWIGFAFYATRFDTDDLRLPPAHSASACSRVAALASDRARTRSHGGHERLRASRTSAYASMLLVLYVACTATCHVAQGGRSRAGLTCSRLRPGVGRLARLARSCRRREKYCALGRGLADRALPAPVSGLAPAPEHAGRPSAPAGAFRTARR